jgi:hypothetical protein
MALFSPKELMGGDAETMQKRHIMMVPEGMMEDTDADRTEKRDMSSEIEETRSPRSKPKYPTYR